MYCRSPLLYANTYDGGGGYPLPPAVSGGEERLPERAAGLGLILSSIFNTYVEKSVEGILGDSIASSLLSVGYL